MFKLRRARPGAMLALILTTGSLLPVLTSGCAPSTTGAYSQTSAATAAATDAYAYTVSAGTMPPPASFFETLAFPSAFPNPARVLRVPILMYHHIGDPPAGANLIRRGLTVSAADFRAQMSYLKNSGFHPIRQADLFQALFESAQLPEKPVIITFDDGYDDNFVQALPVLQSYGFPATFNIITAFVGTAGYMTWDQIRALDVSGMDIGSHTVDHKDLSILSRASLEHELDDSGQALSVQLEHPVYWLCYPSGEYSAKVEAAARAAGYLMATTTKYGLEQSSAAPYELKRVRVRNDSGLAGFEQLLK